ncbi:1-aminocyclopropane-1-carboxylate deaminase/D-cysteine desulfhydrase [Vibrio sp. V27_P1S3P104]|uniref:1-aminocyclopropane-1-carboxylate deaminase/D-cysteine desulfhydrase n=1 Tax=unclassified Vibrio TaxID=2614977 RepID=UPI00137337EC|nr:MULTISPECIES: 1-aminocyclopropane-1-carboxylate deaminase/D-cysteine desulfhydrase [unclassified Vibrio]NAW68007.1 1-aminocyclopropane-1-carboxylate deaminase/D-cysteine desulfhydrase [Vibrio sp. V28_P6S34P95]NAX04909.1 1-aminocyclopropane-1-carboxylate deaminase/D-cysteine desulfhydrase [Vibrio sp. V30_P3S12P165]NAX34376.1 1-aminocyclopropane-1-carboxylate deaminase/D-cysteine desulfhydrase [Vibrio sp. V29_P1S30P107]NAX38467.1 1-aminocyclopropane-1-carboxylate deaminase/D-cysteine desulfhyd
MKLTQSPITEHRFQGHAFYLKRDDQLHPQFCGNKARKFLSLLQMERPEINTLISYGSVQANSLYSLAGLAAIHGWQLEYYVHHIPDWLKQYPIGNYRAALELEANVIETKALSPNHPHQYILQIRKPDEQCLFIEEGGRTPLAEYGIKQLAHELLTWIQQQPKQRWAVALPSGTGTTALYLHKALSRHEIEVITCPCVGGQTYLEQQWQQLGESDYPTILSPERKHHFGRLYYHDYQIWQQLHQQTHVEFELLYDPLMWRCLMDWLPLHNDLSLIYLHQGGLLGNESMLPRYQRQWG